MKSSTQIYLCLLVLLLPRLVAAQPSDSELAKQLANPLASLISVPFQLNYDRNIGPVDDGERFTLNIQPVVPFQLNDEWNLISRTILPLIRQSDVAPGLGDQSGTGDIVQSLFFSPIAPSENGWTWGVGPVFLLPTGSNDRLTADKWGLGPTAVALKQDGPWTYGALVNHIWSVAGEDARADVNATFLQPFLSYATPTGISYTLNTESTYNWETSEWTVPILLGIGKVSKLGDQTVQYNASLRYYVDSPTSGPKDLAFRFVFVLIFPK
jgi:hypothetical protein